MTYDHPHEVCDRRDEHVRSAARRRRTGRSLCVTASWWRRADETAHEGEYSLTWQGELGAAVRTERLGAWPEACDHRECHLMTAVILGCELFIRTGRGPNGTLNSPSPRPSETLWPHLLQAEAAREWRTNLPLFSAGQFLDCTSAGVSITEFTRYGGGLEQTEVMLHSMAHPTRQWVPEMIGYGTDPSCEHPWCMMEALNTTLSAHLAASHSYPAHAEEVAKLLQEPCAPWM